MMVPALQTDHERAVLASTPAQGGRVLWVILEWRIPVEGAIADAMPQARVEATKITAMQAPSAAATPAALSILDCTACHIMS
jgi:hypothetical protein